MKRTVFTILTFLTFCFSKAQEQQNDTLAVFPSPPKLTAKGYLRELPTFNIPPGFNQVYFDNILHNRLNFRYFPSNNLTLAFEIRNRLLSGHTIKNTPFVIDYLWQDPARLDMSWVPLHGEGWAVHTHIDRLYADLNLGQWQVRAGRQRINWGINMASNPNDLFNTYSFFDFDHAERPGNDALRVQRYLKALSRIELAISPAEVLENSVAAILYGFNRKGYDFQLITAYYHNRIAIGGGWAGNIKTTGFKGEVTYFHSIDPLPGETAGNIVAAVSADHLFPSTIFILGEFLYNQKGGTQINNIGFLTQPLRADNLSFARYQILGQAGFSFTPILSSSIAAIVYPTDRSFFIGPNINWSVRTNLDANLIVQHFNGRRESLLSQAGTTIAAGLKWSF